MAGYALLCPGQGAQHPRMLDLALQSEAGRDVVAVASDTVSINIAARIEAGDELFDPVFAQVAIVATSVATWRALQSLLPPPSLVAGYSVGEVSSWSCAGSWSMDEVMRVVAQRARLMSEASPKDAAMMALTGMRRELLPAILELHHLHIAIEVDDDHWVIAGRRADLDAATSTLEAAGASPHPLPVGVPSHTPLLDAAAAKLREFMRNVTGRDPDAAVLRGIDGKALFRYAEAGDALADAVSHPIRWRACMDELGERGIGAALELPPGTALTRMLAGRPAATARAVADFRSLEGVARWLERVE
jgi:[acyl-carrier-protein] S-malonyltransferase